MFRYIANMSWITNQLRLYLWIYWSALLTKFLSRQEEQNPSLKSNCKVGSWTNLYIFVYFYIMWVRLHYFWLRTCSKNIFIFFGRRALSINVESWCIVYLKVVSGAGTAFWSLWAETIKLPFNESRFAVLDQFMRPWFYGLGIYPW